MANSGSPRKRGSGNRRPPGSGNRSAATRRSGAPASAKPTQGAPEPEGSDKPTADERARERLSQPRATGGGKRPPPRGGSRPGGGIDPRRRRPQNHSTGRTAGIFGGAFVALAIVVILLISLLGGGKSGGATGNPIAAQPAPASLVSALAKVSSSTSQLSAAGLGGSLVTVKGVFTPTPKAKAITQGGKPVLVYIGAEYCPYCAASRWALIIALNRFGSFTGLETVASSPYDTWANTRTFSFAKATYTSPYLVFEPTEYTSNACAVAISSNSCPNDQYKTLQPLSTLDKSLLTTYENSSLSIPFFAWGGKYISAGALYLPTVINLGNSQTALGWHPMSWDEILQNINSSPLTSAGQAILGTANVYTGAICDMTNNQPGSVCDTPMVKQAQTELAAA
jgi:hypothetical protein